MHFYIFHTRSKFAPLDNQKELNRVFALNILTPSTHHHTLDYMKIPPFSWILAGLWDAIRILLLYILVILNEQVIPRPLLYAVILAPGFAFSALAILNSQGTFKSTDTTLAWILGKIIGLVALGFLLVITVRNSFDVRGLLATLAGIQSFLLITIGILLGDLWTLGIIALPIQKEQRMHSQEEV